MLVMRQLCKGLSMNSPELVIPHFPHWTIADQEHAPEKGKLIIRVKHLNERDRRRLLMHFLDLEENDRLLRFRKVTSDELITRYVQKLNLVRDTVFGVYDDALQLVGVGHLGFTPCEALQIAIDADKKVRIAEFGLSVSASARGRGIGSRLFERVALHCRNADIDTLYMHCLASNQAIMHIAKKAGMEIQHDHSEANAYLKISPANPASVVQEATDEQIAILDYNLKLSTCAMAKSMA
jgi:RimJ/RimL family protein N-acetyltransferase